jgi:hypothetical protein
MSSLPSPKKAKEKLPNADEQRMRWFLAFFLLFSVLTSIIVPSIVFWATKNVLSFSLFSALLPLNLYLCRRFAAFLLPLSDKDHQLEMKKIELRMKILETQRKHGEKRLSTIVRHKTISSNPRSSSLVTKQVLNGSDEDNIRGDSYDE